MPFKFESQNIRDIILIKPKVFGDIRGCFLETYKKSEFESNGIKEEFVQSNYSKSVYGVIRGLHYQAKPHSQAKLISCIHGVIVDIVVDIRPFSKTFKQYLRVELSETNKDMLYIPRGFAHGFAVISKEAEILYKTTSEYYPASERGILWNDKELRIDWGINFTPILSDKDKALPKFSEINLEEIV